MARARGRKPDRRRGRGTRPIPIRRHRDLSDQAAARVRSVSISSRVACTRRACQAMRASSSKAASGVAPKASQIALTKASTCRVAVAHRESWARSMLPRRARIASASSRSPIQSRPATRARRCSAMPGPNSTAVPGAACSSRCSTFAANHPPSAPIGARLARITAIWRASSQRLIGRVFVSTVCLLAGRGLTCTTGKRAGADHANTGFRDAGRNRTDGGAFIGRGAPVAAATWTPATWTPRDRT